MPKRRAGRKWAASLVLILALVLSSLPAMAKVGQTYYCAVEGLSVHLKASMKSASVGTLGRADPVIHMGTKNGMWRVRARGGEGFVKPKSKAGDPHLLTRPLEKDGVYTVTGIKKLALRLEPMKKAPVQAVVKRYQPVKLKKLDGYWGYVITQDGSGGWLRIKYIKPLV